MSSPAARVAANPMVWMVGGAIFAPVASVTYALGHGLTWWSGGFALAGSLAAAIPLRGQSTARLAVALMAIYLGSIVFLVLAEAVSHPSQRWTPY